MTVAASAAAVGSCQHGALVSGSGFGGCGLVRPGERWNKSTEITVADWEEEATENICDLSDACECCIPNTSNEKHRESGFLMRRLAYSADLRIFIGAELCIMQCIA